MYQTSRNKATATAGAETGGTVTSVALSMPSIFSVGGSPITADGTLAVTFNTAVANRVFAGPTTGADATPAFRNLVTADMPSSVVLNTLATTKGDLLAATAASVLARLGVGSNGQVLTADSGETTGLKWSTLAAGSGDVVGPSSAVNNNVVLFNGTTGKLVKDSGLTLAGTNTGDTAGRHAIPVMSAAISSTYTNGCQALTVASTGANKPDVVTLNFDYVTQEYAQFSIPMPKSWNESTVTFKPVWSHAATTTNFGVTWSLQGVAMSDGDLISGAYGTAQSSVDVGGVTDTLYVGPESSAITIAGTPQEQDIVHFRITREVSGVSGQMAIDARLHGVILYITTNAENDA